MVRFPHTLPGLVAPHGGHPAPAAHLPAHGGHPMPAAHPAHGGSPMPAAHPLPPHPMQRPPQPTHPVVLPVPGLRPIQQPAPLPGEHPLIPALRNLLLGQVLARMAPSLLHDEGNVIHIPTEGTDENGAPVVFPPSFPGRIRVGPAPGPEPVPPGVRLPPYPGGGTTLPGLPRYPGGGFFR